ncbi:MAG: Smr/MutS family protein [Desulfovibrionales bacterium]
MQQPFKKLQNLKIDKSNKNKNTGKKHVNDRKEPEQDTHSEEETIEEHDDRAIFLSAMSGVKPIQKKKRQVSPPNPKNKQSFETNQDEMETLQKLVDGRIDFDLSMSDEHIEGYVHGIDSKIFNKLKNGQFSIEGNLDLHGMNSDQARVALITFIRDHYLAGSRCVLVIPGRGKRSPLKMGILKKELQTWLTQEPLKRTVLAFCTSLPRHGGTGAVYILLRRYRKNRGRIIWDKYLLDLESY